MRKLVCILFLCLSLPTWAQTSIVVNSSFEDRSNFLKGWDSAFGAGGLLVTPTAADGQNFAMITGDLFQDLPTIPGQVYQLRFALAGDPYWQGLTTLQIYWGGSLVASSYFNTTGHSNENLGWIYVTNNFLATLSTTRLWFGNPGYAVSTIPYLDAVTVIPVDASPTTCIPPPDGIMAWWPGQGTALDSVGGHNGTFLNGPGFTNGMVDKGFYFPGSNQCVQIPYASFCFVLGALASRLPFNFWPTASPTACSAVTKFLSAALHI